MSHKGFSMARLMSQIRSGFGLSQAANFRASVVKSLSADMRTTGQNRPVLVVAAGTPGFGRTSFLMDITRAVRNDDIQFAVITPGSTNSPWIVAKDGMPNVHPFRYDHDRRCEAQKADLENGGQSTPKFLMSVFVDAVTFARGRNIHWLIVDKMEMPDGLMTEMLAWRNRHAAHLGLIFATDYPKQLDATPGVPEKIVVFRHMGELSRGVSTFWPKWIPEGEREALLNTMQLFETPPTLVPHPGASGSVDSSAAPRLKRAHVVMLRALDKMGGAWHMGDADPLPPWRFGRTRWLGGFYRAAALRNADTESHRRHPELLTREYGPSRDECVVLCKVLHEQGLVLAHSTSGDGCEGFSLSDEGRALIREMDAKEQAVA
ncbi:TPA: hypothetical protein ACYLN4_000548 [Burkholderia lata]